MNHMRALAAVGLIFLAGPSATFADLADLDVDGLIYEASDIVVGKVVDVDSRCTIEDDDQIHDTFEVSIKVESVEKGSSFEVGHVVVVHAWQLRYIPGNNPFRYMTSHGHHEIPAVGQSVRAYLTEMLDAGGFEAVLPNGFAPSDGGGMLTTSHTLSPYEFVFFICPLWARILIFIAIIGCGSYFATWRLNRHPEVREAKRKLQELAKYAH